MPRNRNIKVELGSFFQALFGKARSVSFVVAGAFTMARAKLKADAFVELNQMIVEYQRAHGDHKTWDGYRLLAADGSTLRIPANQETREHFVSTKNVHGGETLIARICQVYDCLNKITVRADIAPRNSCERDMLVKQLDSLGEVDLLLLDREYPGFFVFSVLRERGIDFFVRANEVSFAEVQYMFKSGETDSIVTLRPKSHKSKKSCRDLGIDMAPITVRLLRYVLPTGSSTVIITSLLDQERHSHEFLGGLYHKRWQVEEDFKTLKARMILENFSGKSVHSVEQNFHAAICFKNLVSFLARIFHDKTDESLIFLYNINQLEGTQRGDSPWQIVTLNR